MVALFYILNPISYVTYLYISMLVCLLVHSYSQGWPPSLQLCQGGIAMQTECGLWPSSLVHMHIQILMPIMVHMGLYTIYIAMTTHLTTVHTSLAILLSDHIILGGDFIFILHKLDNKPIWTLMTALLTAS